VPEGCKRPTGGAEYCQGEEYPGKVGERQESITERMEQGENQRVGTTAGKIQRGVEFASCRTAKVCKSRVMAFLTLTNICNVPREQVSQFKREHLNSFDTLDSASKRILDAIVDQHDIFQEAHEAQLTLTKSLHEDTMRKIDDTHHEIIREITVIFLSLPLPFSPVQPLLTLF